MLVTIQDDRPVPKIIDFGVAKATAQKLTERSLFTELGVLIGTPEYMSPEQAEMGGLDIDTRTDIYALGALLYELLTGALPFDRKDLRQASIAEIQRIIREKEPRRPSTRIKQHGPASGEVAKNRHTEPRRLVGALRGDLDWITMRALEKDRTRRYQTANALAADLRRHLNSEPVYAGPPSATYRAWKFVRRHRAGVAVAAILFVLLAGFAGVMAVQAHRIARERNRANREAETARYVSEFLVSLFEVSKPSDRAANSVTAREILDAAAQRMDHELGEEPEIRAALLTTMGEVYASLGQRSRAASLNEEALALRRQLWGPRHPEVAASLSAVAALSDEPAKSDRLLREALGMQRQLSGVRPDDLTRTLIELADALSTQGRYGDAEPFAREALQTAQSAHQKPHPLVVQALTEVGVVLMGKAQYKEAEEAWRSVIDAAIAVYGPQHFATLGGRENMASAQIAQGRYAEAEASYREILRLETPLVDAGHPTQSVTLGNLGAALFYQKKYREAEAYYRQALDISRAAYGSAHPDVAICLANLGQALDAQGRHNEAVETLDEAVSVSRKALGNDSPNLATPLRFLSDAFRHSGRVREAEEAAREALAIDTKHLGGDHPRTQEAEGALGRALARQRRWAEAEPLVLRYGAALERGTGVEGDLHEVTLEIAALYEGWGKSDKAKEWLAKLERQAR